MTNTRPISVLVVACLYIAVGIAGFVFHFHDSLAHPHEGIWIEVTEIVALVCGAFMLQRQNWARWLALAWMLFHVILSIHHPVQLVIHALICAAIAWALFHPAAGRYFREPRLKQT